MKTLTNTIAATALIFATVASASAAVSYDLGRDIHTAAGAGSDILITVDGDTVTLIGHVKDIDAIQRIEAAAEKNGATQVNNYVTRSR